MIRSMIISTFILMMTPLSIRAQGQIWSQVGGGTNNAVSSLAEFGGNIYATGNFQSAGGTSVGFIARWNGTSWMPLTSGLDDFGSVVYNFNSFLYVGGSFQTAGGVSSPGIAKWDGAAWSAVGLPLGAPASEVVTAISAYAGYLYVGCQTNGEPANLYRYTGSNLISIGTVTSPGGDGLVSAMAEFGGDLYIGGQFSSVNGVPANNIARWDGTTWSAVGSPGGTNGSVNALIARDKLYVGGGFGTVGNGVPATGIATWDGSVWASVGAPGGGVSGGSAVVYALANDYITTTLYVGGSFTSVDGTPAANIAAWDDLNWSPVGGDGMDNTVHSIQPTAAIVYAGGTFLHAGDIVSPYIAKLISCQPNTFTSISAPLTGVGNSSDSWADFDDDGDLDILITGGVSGGVAVSKLYRNDDGLFTDLGAGLTSMSAGAAAWGDYDRDGDLDLLMSGDHPTGGGSTVFTTLYRNDGGGMFTDVGASLPPAYNTAAGWGDYDNDGDPDIVILGSGGVDPHGLYRNDGSGTFTYVATTIPEITDGSVCWGDYDIDGDLDLLVAGRPLPATLVDLPITKVFRNDGGGTFTEAASLDGIYIGQAAWGDYDNDGSLDILLSGATAYLPPYDPVTIVYHNVSGSFSALPLSLPAGYAASVAWGDYDNDGKSDFVVAGNGVVPTIYKNNGGGSFSPISVPTAGGADGCLAWGDFDNDHDLDLLATGSGSANIYRNDLCTPNTRPAIPGGLTATPSGSDITFSWAAASDAETPAAGLTYGLRVGITPGGSEVFPATSGSDGFQRIPGYGNVGSKLNWTISGLSAGELYYWTVEAVDNAFDGSGFAGESNASTEPVVKILSPDCGEVWKEMKTKTITWASENVNQVKIELLIGGILQAPPIATGVSAAAGMYAWEVPSTPTTEAKIRITSEDNPLVSDESDCDFTVSLRWDQQEGFVDKKLNDVSFPNMTRGLVVGDGSLIYHTNDGGTSWVTQTLGSYYKNTNLTGVSFIDGEKGWIAGWKGATGYVFRTPDAGGTWSSEGGAHSPWIFNDIHQVSWDHGWLVGAYWGTNWGMIRKTTDGWRKSKYIYGAEYPRLNGIHIRPDKLTGWAVGNSGKVLKTVDGGETWPDVMTVSTEHLNDLSFVNNLKGWIVGNSGKIYHTDDGGASWSEQVSGTSENLNGISMINSDHGWAVGDNGTILRYDATLANTTAAAAGWTGVESGTIKDLTCVSFHGGTFGWIGGDSGAVFQYSPTAAESAYIAVNVFMQERWNMVSLPLTVGDDTLGSLIPGATGDAYEFIAGSGYFSSGTLTNRKGYWVKIPSAHHNDFIGSLRHIDTIEVKAGWNMIGSISDTVPVSAVIAEGTTVVSNYYSYDLGYTPSAYIIPGRAYWVKVSSDGILILSGTAAMPPAQSRLRTPEEFTGMTAVTLTDGTGNRQVLFIDPSTPDESHRSRYELPPPPPIGVFDARFSTNRFVESYDLSKGVHRRYVVALSSGVSPLTISIEMGDLGGSAVTVDGVPVNDGRTIIITKEHPDVLLIEVGNQLTTPTEYSLEQAFPNPFNPATTIGFTLPQASLVTLKIYDILGREVAVPVRSLTFQAGRHNVVFNAEALPSGVYFYRLHAGGFVGSKKMLLTR